MERETMGPETQGLAGLGDRLVVGRKDEGKIEGD